MSRSCTRDMPLRVVVTYSFKQHSVDNSQEIQVCDFKLYLDISQSIIVAVQNKFKCVELEQGT